MKEFLWLRIPKIGGPEMTIRTIDVVRTVKNLTCLDLKGREIHIGDIQVDEYGEAEAKRFLFEVSDDNPWATKGKQYALGVGSSNLSFVNPADAQRVVTEKGFQPVTQYHQRGGLRIVTEYFHPELWSENAFDYDRAQWNWRRLPDEDIMRTYTGVQIVTDLQVGRMAVKYLPGLYRSVCTNGLFSQLLEWGGLNVRHVDWDVKAMQDHTNAFMDPVENQTGPVITSGEHLQKAVNLLERYWDEITAGELSSQMQLLEKQFTGISSNVLKDWAVEGYLDAMNRYLKHEDNLKKDVHMIHLVNAYTSGVNAHRLRQGDRGVLAALDSIDAVVTTTASLANISSIFN